jgi:hypothetical protein
MSAIAEIFFLDTLQRENGYQSAKPIGNGRYACVMPLAFTAAIITGRMGERDFYDDRWCYHTMEAAKAALDAWDGVGEPAGWHRHPATGRRRKDGNPDAEMVWL